MNKPLVPIFYACDDNFAKYALVSMSSMIEHADKERQYVIHVLNTNISPEIRENMQALANEQFAIRFVDVTEYTRSIAHKLPLRDYYSMTTYYRLFISEMFPEYSKGIYIDSDTVVLGDISKLYDQELGQNLVGAAQDQVFVQMDVYGTYAEEVLGIDRSQMFNAGLLLINCQAFRQEAVLAQFIDLLYMYHFVVTQDEDYLNLICKDRVLWLDQRWNTLIVGEIPYDIRQAYIVHYNMSAKPWHYADCRYQEIFWEYAAKTPVYDDLRRELASYTQEQRQRDAYCGHRLAETAQRETQRPDNYLKLKNAGKLKSADRIRVLQRIADLESQGIFDKDVEEDPPGRELMPDEVDYLRQRLSSRLKARMTFSIARPFLKYMLKEKRMIVKDIVGIEHYNSLHSGAIITCNHFNAFDSFAMQMAYEASTQRGKRKLYRIIREGNYTSFPGFYGMLMRNCNTLPLSSNAETMKEFIRATNTVLQNGDLVLVYPEQSMWWNYRKPKPLKKGAFTLATRNLVPVLPIFITMDDSDVLGDDGFWVQEYTIYIGTPVYPKEELSRMENVRWLMEENARQWKEVYEAHYGEKLQYLCGEPAEQ